MTTIRQLIQTSPAKANELFAKLVDTSETAVKTRDRLFSELKVELELLAKLEEQHLLPVLKKHKGTKTVVLEALNNNQQARKLLAELERTPKDSEDFATKVADLRKVFQQHVRDERNELLPAVLKALSDEEADSVVEKIEEEKAEIASARRAEVEERRTEARHEREEIETVQQVAEGLANTVQAGTAGVQQMTRTAQDTFQNGLATAMDVAQQSRAELMHIFGLSARKAQGSTQDAAKNVQSIAQSSTILARGFQDVSREWVAMSADRFQRNLDGLTVLSRCRSVQDLVAWQTSLVRGNLEISIEHSRRFIDLATRILDETPVPSNEPTEKNREEPRRAA